MNFLQIKEEIPRVAPDILFHILGWPISNTFLLSVFILGLFLVLGFCIKLFFRINPSGPQTFAEIAYEWMVSLVAQLTGSEKKAEGITPLIASLFIFIAVANLISVVPGITSIQYNGVSIFRSPTTDFNTTFGLALTMILLVNLTSLKVEGAFGYVGKFLQVRQVYRGFKKGFGEGLMASVNFLIGLLDIISEFAKVISLSLRLFGNIYAGEVLLVVLFGAVAYLMPSVWLMLSILFGLIQAIVFGSLVAAYYGQALGGGAEEV